MKKVLRSVLALLSVLIVVPNSYSQGHNHSSLLKFITVVLISLLSLQISFTPAFADWINPFPGRESPYIPFSCSRLCWWVSADGTETPFASPETESEAACMESCVQANEYLSSVFFQFCDSNSPNYDKETCDGYIDDIDSELVVCEERCCRDGFFNDDRLVGDVNGDGYVNSDDLNLVRAHWGEFDLGILACYNPDITGDYFVDSADLDVIRANWGSSYTAASAK